MSHHYSGPNVGFPRGDARLDLTDLFAFPNPADPGRSILVMDAHPSWSLMPPEPTTAEPFAPEAVYELRIDTNGDAVADIGYRLRVSAAAGGGQTATLRRAEGAQAAGMGDEGRVIAEGIPVSTGRQARATESGDHRVFVGKRSDPFFFDVQGALHDMKFTGDDYFADKDVFSLVLDVPNAALGSGPVGLWMRVLMPAPEGVARLGSGRTRGAPLADAVLVRRGERRLPGRGAQGRRPLRRSIRARAGAHRRIHARGSDARSPRAAARHHDLRSQAPSLLPQQRPAPHRRRASTSSCRS